MNYDTLPAPEWTRATMEALRARGITPELAQTRESALASMTGSQIAPYAYAASNVIWVGGAQKITASLEEAVRRVREHVLPREDKRMREFSVGRTGSMIGKLPIFEHETPLLNRRITMLIVQQKTGD